MCARVSQTLRGNLIVYLDVMQCGEVDDCLEKWTTMHLLTSHFI
jgi:hypothetical protein